MRVTLLRWGLVAGWLGVVAACSSTGGASAPDTPVEGDGGQGGASGKGGKGGKGGTAGKGSAAGQAGGAGPAGSGPGAGAGGQGEAGAGNPFGGSGGVNLGGSGGAGGLAECAAFAQKADAKVLPADIIWVIDTSGSMSEETASVQQKMNNFAQGILSVGIDVRVVLIAEEFGCDAPFPQWCDNPLFIGGMCLPAPLGSGQCPKDSNPPNYFHDTTTVNSTDGLLKIIETYPNWKDVLRPDSVKFVVAVTDDDAISGAYAPESFPDKEKGAAQQFIKDFTALDPAKLTGFKMSGIYCQSNCASAASVGKVWDEVVNQTQGVKGDLCKQDFQPIFNDLAKGVVASAKLSCSWKIPPPPDGQQFDPGLVNVKFTSGSNAEKDIFFAGKADQCDPQKGGWYYDDPGKPTAVVACPATCTEIQADNQGKIDVLFGCATRPIDIN